jgi:nicotinamide-nucleotide amidase
MRCEVIAVGTELLLGQIVDTNSTWIGEQLASAGIDSHFQTKVGDNHERMVACLRLALERSDAVILCGGLGPTQDDITRETIAEVMGVGFTRRPEIGEKIRALFVARGRVMPDNNLRQADVPDGASVIPQMPGTAPGLICPLGDKVIYAVPGVPHEMREMVSGAVIPDLRQRAGVGAVIKSRVLRTWGHSESGLAELLAQRIDELDRLGNPTLAFQASGIEGLKVRITAKAPDDQAAEAVLAGEEALLREILGDFIFGLDDQTMEAVVLDLLKQRGLSLAVAEPVTGGLMAARLNDVPGADQVFRGALVCPVGALDRGLLALPEGPLETAEAAQAMAEGVRKLLGADVGLAAIEAAPDAAPNPVGSDAAEDRTVGLFLALAMNGNGEAQAVRPLGNRSRSRQYAVISLLDVLRRRLLAAAARG